MILKFLYFLWGYKSVKRTDESLRVEIDCSYTETYIRAAIVLPLFGSALLSLFLSGYSSFLFYYGLPIILIFILFFIVLKIIIIPEIYFYRILGYTLHNKVDTSIPNRQRIVKVVEKKSHGLFQSSAYSSFADINTKNYTTSIDPTGHAESNNLPQGESYGVTSRLFSFNNYIVGVSPVLTLIIMMCTSIFSLIPIINILLVLLFAYDTIFLFSVLWKKSNIFNKFILLLILIYLIAISVITATVNFIVFHGF